MKEIPNGLWECHHPHQLGELWELLKEQEPEQGADGRVADSMATLQESRVGIVDGVRIEAEEGRGDHVDRIPLYKHFHFDFSTVVGDSVQQWQDFLAVVFHTFIDLLHPETESMLFGSTGRTGCECIGDCLFYSSRRPHLLVVPLDSRAIFEPTRQRRTG